jgi:hypothetical protein
MIKAFWPALLVATASLGCGAEGGDSSGGSYPRGLGGNGGGKLNGGGASSGSGALADQYFGDKLKPGDPGTNGSGETACALKRFNLDRKPPELMLVLDRSGSMQRDAAGNAPNAPGFMAPTRWDATTSALDAVLHATQAGVAWGLELFPYPKTTTQTDPLACKGDAPPTNQPAFNAHDAIMGVVNASAPPLDIGTTPTRAAIATAVAYLKTRTTPNPKYLLLATDGEPNECANPNNPANARAPTPNLDATVAAVQASADAGFPVFVVGLAIGDKADAMNRLAAAGGRPREGATKFYPANSTAELETALTTIASAISDCTFVLGTAPPVPQDVAVDVGDARVGQDAAHKNGWDFGGPDKKTIVLYGPLCDDVKAGKVRNAAISWTCPGMPIP